MAMYIVPTRATGIEWQWSGSYVQQAHPTAPYYEGAPPTISPGRGRS